MKAIVFYSITGNTRSIAERLSPLTQAKLLEVKAINDDPKIQNPILKEIPKIDDFEHLVVASPVHGFMLSKVMKAYIKQTDFSNKKVDLFVTHFFPYAWMGGSQTLKQMRKLITQQGGQVMKMMSINWKNKNRDRDIENLLELFSA